MYTEQITQAMAIAAPISPQTLNSGGTASATSGGVDLSLSRRAIFIAEIGTVTGGGAVTVKLVESANANMSSPSDLAGNNVSLAGLNTSNKQYTFEVRAGQITKRYVALKITETGGQNVVCAAVAIGMEGSHKPDNANNDASVVTQNVVS